MHLAALDQQLVHAMREHALPAALGMARLAACLAWLPYLAGGAISSRLVRNVLALIVLVGIWPVTQGVVLPADKLGLLLHILAEVLIGSALGLMLALPYHVFHALGSMLDGQRGASIGAALDPLSGVEATESAQFLQMFSAVVFLAAGGLLPLLETIRHSYALLPMGTLFMPDIASLHGFVDLLMLAALRMAAPVLVLLLLVEIMLGILSRFAQQMNAFSVSLAVKSFIAFLALLLYLPRSVTERVPVLWRELAPLRVLLPGVPA